MELEPRCDIGSGNADCDCLCDGRVEVTFETLNKERNESSTFHALISIFRVLPITGRSNWILHRKWEYSICCLGDVILEIVERDLSNSI